MKPTKHFVRWPYYQELSGYGYSELEALYAAFKERLLSELRVESDELLLPARLADKEQDK